MSPFLSRHASFLQHLKLKVIKVITRNTRVFYYYLIHFHRWFRRWLLNVSAFEIKREMITEERVLIINILVNHIYQKTVKTTNIDNVHQINQFILIARCYQYDSVEISLFVLENVLSYRPISHFHSTFCIFFLVDFARFARFRWNWLNDLWCDAQNLSTIRIVSLFNSPVSMMFECVNSLMYELREFVEYHIRAVVLSIFLVVYNTLDQNRKPKLISSQNLASRIVNCDHCMMCVFVSGRRNAIPIRIVIETEKCLSAEQRQRHWFESGKRDDESTSRCIHSIYREAQRLWIIRLNRRYYKYCKQLLIPKMQLIKN